MAAMTARYTPSADEVMKRIALTTGRQTAGLKALPAPTRFNKRAALQVVRASNDKVLLFLTLQPSVIVNTGLFC